MTTDGVNPVTSTATPASSSTAGEGVPFFSIIIPVWNRGDVIAGCLASVLTQDFTDYEIIAVDDGSRDDSVAVMQAIKDPRLKVLRHEKNAGVCAARHTATAAARGLWILSLDSDWELLPGALSRLAAFARSKPLEVGVIGGRARSDDGEIWPANPLPEGSFGFHEHLTWADTHLATDYLSCRRREVFEQVQWPTDRRLEMQFNFRVAQRWKTSVSQEVLALAHTHCKNRYMTDETEEGIIRRLERAPAEAAATCEILTEFGRDLSVAAPRLRHNLIRIAAIRCFQAGWRFSGLKYGLWAILRKPWLMDMYPIVCVGILGPGIIRRVRQLPLARDLFRWLQKSG